MEIHESTENPDAGSMHARRVTMPDGRYLIYYTFGDEPGPRPAEPPRPEPGVTPEITGEHRV